MKEKERDEKAIMGSLYLLLDICWLWPYGVYDKLGVRTIFCHTKWQGVVGLIL